MRDSSAELHIQAPLLESSPHILGGSGSQLILPIEHYHPVSSTRICPTCLLAGSYFHFIVPCLKKAASIGQEHRHSRAPYQVTCYVYQKPGHRASECWFRERRDQHNNSKKDNKPSAQREVVCYVCDTPGHFASECNEAKSNKKDNRSEKKKVNWVSSRNSKHCVQGKVNG